MKLTQRDPHQIVQHTHDEEHNATRVIFAQGLQLDTSNIESAIKDAFQHIKMPASTFDASPLLSIPNIQTISIPTIVTEYKTIEVPVFVDRIQYVDRNVYIEVPKIIEIEKQTIVKEQLITEVKIPMIIKEYVNIPLWFKLAVGASILTNLLLMFKK